MPLLKEGDIWYTDNSKICNDAFPTPRTSDRSPIGATVTHIAESWPLVTTPGDRIEIPRPSTCRGYRLIDPTNTGSQWTRWSQRREAPILIIAQERDVCRATEWAKPHMASHHRAGNRCREEPRRAPSHRERRHDRRQRGCSFCLRPTEPIPNRTEFWVDPDIKEVVPDGKERFLRESVVRSHLELRS